MIPIYEQGNGRGIGLLLDDFLQRMDEICAEHVNTGRAKAVAIILRDANDRDLKRILRDQGAYAKLDRLSGTQLSVFFMHTASDEALSQFNRAVGDRLGFTNARLPAVAFFRAAVDETGAVGFSSIEVKSLDHANIIHGLLELYELIEKFAKAPNAEPFSISGKGTKLKSAGKFVTIEAFRAALREGISLLF